MSAATPAPEWRIHPSGMRHAIVRRGDTRYACGEPVLHPRFAGSDKPKVWCPDCLDATGLVVAGPAPSQESVAGWEENEKREAFGR